ncbi:unnamed protein product [Aspergillus oryzae]|uniref:Unnamed protein product n=1 Tax=Aspergillus oryzae TaxID=5062 RepID=A0AAN4YPB4_ASPOZ|nr:unnamed protein product [Aspergillus oryzae]GMG33477.1 unnamed protein product [Aspergillus oryzae]
MVDDLGWWTVPIVSLVIFTLYGIEGIGSQLEDPFGYDRNDIKMDAIVGDSKMEIDVVLSEWRKLMSFVEAETPRTESRCVEDHSDRALNIQTSSDSQNHTPTTLLKRNAKLPSVNRGVRTIQNNPISIVLVEQRTPPQNEGKERSKRPSNPQLLTNHTQHNVGIILNNRLHRTESG